MKDTFLLGIFLWRVFKSINSTRLLSNSSCIVCRVRLHRFVRTKAVVVMVRISIYSTILLLLNYDRRCLVQSSGGANANYSLLRLSKDPTNDDSLPIIINILSTNDVPIGSTNSITTNSTNTVTNSPTKAVTVVTHFPTPTHSPSKKYIAPPDDDTGNDDEVKKIEKDTIYIGYLFLWVGITFVSTWTITYYRTSIFFYMGNLIANTRRHGCKVLLHSIFPFIGRSSRRQSDTLDQIIFETDDDAADPLLP